MKAIISGCRDRLLVEPEKLRPQPWLLINQSAKEWRRVATIGVAVGRVVSVMNYAWLPRTFRQKSG
ncbi:MAG TPA: hypothetical protein DCY79_20410 [Planctomycetaceae bacterium]|nr:hypothetical protein [Blastopirellula sp.]HAY82175.1 hypothetical protein [Planctomycetaceae bacterium]